MSGEKREHMNGIDRVRAERPLIHSITNIVAANMTANGLLAIGAAPVMADAPDEVGEMVAHAQALMINTGTPSRDRVKAMIVAGKEANERNIPVILDPVAVGATTFRTTLVEQLLQEIRVDVIRGNVGEIAALANVKGTVRGVDTAIDKIDEKALMNIARELQATIVASGEIDLITNGKRLTRCMNGTSMLQKVTGTGCLLSAVISAHIAVSEDPYHASVRATLLYNIAAEKATDDSKGPGTFYVQFLDQLASVTDEDVNANMRMERRDR